MARMLSTSANRLARVAQGRADMDFSGRPSSCPRAGHERLDRRASMLRWPCPRVGLDGRPACPQDRHPPTLARGPAPTPALKPGAGVRRAGGVHPFPFTGTVPRACRASRRPRPTPSPSQFTPARGSPSLTAGPDGPVIHRPPSGAGHATATTSGPPGALDRPPGRDRLDRPAPRSAAPSASASTVPAPRCGARLDRPRRQCLDPRAAPTGGGGETRRRQAPPMSAVDTHSSANFRAPGWTKLGERNSKPLPGLHILPEGLSCALHTPAAAFVAPESVWRPSALTAVGQLPTERNSVS